LNAIETENNSYDQKLHRSRYTANSVYNNIEVIKIPANIFATYKYKIPANIFATYIYKKPTNGRFIKQNIHYITLKLLQLFMTLHTYTLFAMLETKQGHNSNGCFIQCLKVPHKYMVFTYTVIETK